MGSAISCLTNPDPISSKNTSSPRNINVNNNNFNNNDNNKNNEIIMPITRNDLSIPQQTLASVSRIQMQLTTNDILTAADLKTFRESQKNVNNIEEQKTEGREAREREPGPTKELGEIVKNDNNINNNNNMISSDIDDGYYDENERKLFNETQQNDSSLSSNIQSDTAYHDIKRMEWKKGDMIGKGAYGTVYMGLNQSSGELMAIKEVQIVPNNGIVKNQNGVRRADQYVQSLESEIAVLSKLSHRNIVKYVCITPTNDNF